jgi:hypothetical protein
MQVTYLRLVKPDGGEGRQGIGGGLLRELDGMSQSCYTAIVSASSALYFAIDRSKESVLPVVKKVLNFYVGVYANQRLIFSL